ncbi:MAG: hypothetical protein GY820_27590 [Gammaproteobacteria bacterium]|nr:hypothetical protein [Gammaproteobacteria bacterium]
MTQNEINQLMRGINRRPTRLPNRESPAHYFRPTRGGTLSGLAAPPPRQCRQKIASLD